MTSLPWVLSGGFIFLWLLCVTHCYRKRNIYRLLFLPPPAVKGVWFLSLLTFSPFVLLAYLILGISIREKEYRSLFTHAFFTLLYLFGVLISIPQFLTFQPEPVQAVRTQEGWRGGEIETGQIVPEWHPFSLRFHTGIIQSNSNISTSTAITSGSNAVLPFRRVVIALENNNPIVYESALILMENLKDIPGLESVEILPVDFNLEPGGRLPDAWIRMGLANRSEITISPAMQLDAGIAMTMSFEPYTSGQGYPDTYSLPYISYNLSCELSHRSLSLWVGTGNAKYDLAAQDIGKELFATIAGFLETNTPKYGSPPPELESLTPERIELVEPPLQIMRDRPPKVDGYLPLAKGVSYWEIPIETDVHRMYDLWAEELEKAGWKKQDRYDKQKDTPYLRYAMENDRIAIFTPRRRNVTDTNPQKSVIQYERRIDLETIQRRLKEIVPQGCTTDFLAMMQNWIGRDEELQREYLHALESLSDCRPKILMQKSDLYGRLNQFDKQWRTLHTTLASLQLMGDTELSEQDIKKKLQSFQEKHAEFATNLSWREIYESLGAREMDLKAGTAIEREIKLYEPVAFFSIDEKGNIRTVSATILENKSTNPTSPYLLQFRDWYRNGGYTATIEASPVAGKPDCYEWNHSTIQNNIRYSVKAHTADSVTFSIRLEIVGTEEI